MSITTPDSALNDPEWGVFARSFIWFLQSSLLGGIAVLFAGLGWEGLIVAGASSFLVVYLLFRHVNALVEQKIG